VPFSILLADEHQILRDGLKNILEQTPDFAVVDEVSTGPDVVKHSRAACPDLVIMDLALPGMSGVHATIETLRQCPRTRIVILSANADENALVSAFRSGARAFLLKTASSADLLDAVRIVSQGGFYMGAHISDLILARLQCGDLTSRKSSLEGLSPREQQVLRLIAEGNTTKDVANVLGLEVQTARTYRKTLMKKLGVTNVAGLTRVAIDAGLSAGLTKDL